MTKEQIKKWKPEIIYWINGGNLWIRSNENWLKCDNDDLVFQRDIYVIEDKHFEARKAFALGEEIELFKEVRGWYKCDNPSWIQSVKYRPKPKEVYEWQRLYKKDKGRYGITDEFFSEVDEGLDWTKFEPSKRIRK